MAPLHVPSATITLYAGLKRYHFATRNVRFGPKADICNAKRHVRSYSKSGHVQCNSACPLCANSGHAHLGQRNQSIEQIH
ncbi:MAG: hypothetical protein WCE27_26380, partial [Pseudolabrys sp.]